MTIGWRGARVVLAASLAVAATAGTAACASPRAGDPSARVVVRIAAQAERGRYEVHLAQARGAYRVASTMRSGETRSFTVPSGWVTVRVPGLCVVPTRASTLTTVEVDDEDCTLR